MTGPISTPVIPLKKNAVINPLKSSAPLGAALAYLGMRDAVPLLHGSQGCTSFALTVAVRHFNEDMPMQTTAIDEVATVLGGAENLEEALINLTGRMKPKFVGIASTALVETRGEDFVGDLSLIRERRPELADTKIVFASTPDYHGALEDGWAKAVTAILEALVDPTVKTAPEARQINILAGVHQTAGDLAALRDLVMAFDLVPVVVPDIGGSMDGHVNDGYRPTTSGGASIEDVTGLGRALHTIALGAHMKEPAETLHRLTGVPTTVLPSVTGLAANDALVVLLTHISGRPVPNSVKLKRSQLIDTMLDCHFHFGGKRIGIAGDPDMLYALATMVTGLGAEVVTAVAATAHSPLLGRVPADAVLVGDLMDFEDHAAKAGVDMILCNSYGRQAADQLGVPHLRIGFPVFDRLGPQHRCISGYDGTRTLIYEIANMFLERVKEKRPQDYASAVPDPSIFTSVQEARYVRQAVGVG